MASCWPMGRPHCTRSAAQRREISRQRLPAATEEMGRVRRPVFNVINASFSPLPSPHSTFSFGTLTFVKRMTPLSSDFNPMTLKQFNNIKHRQLDQHKYVV